VAVGWGSLRTARMEMREQPSRLAKFSAVELPRARQGSILVGAGDSFAAALVGQHLSAGRMIAADPYVLAATPSMAQGRDVYIVSVSGRTRTNIGLAKLLRGISRKTLAVTGDTNSPLASEADVTISMPYRHRARRLPGLLAFTLSLVAVMKLLGLETRCDFRGASQPREGGVLSSSGTTYYLGNGALSGVALYAAAKTYEILGWRAHAEFLEEFSHMEVLSLSGSDSVNILGGSDPLGYGAKLRDSLEREGFSVSLWDGRGGSVAESIFRSVFMVQSILLEEAKNKKMRYPHLAGAQRQLRISDAMI